MNEFDMMKKRPAKPRHQDPFWVQCFTAALTGAAAHVQRRHTVPDEGATIPERPPISVTITELVQRALEIADEATALVRQENNVRVSPELPHPRERGGYHPSHVGTVKPAKTT